MITTAETGQHSAHRSWRIAGLTLAALVLWACDGDDAAPAATPAPNSMPEPGPEPGPEPASCSIAFCSSSALVGGVASVLNLNGLSSNNVVMAEAGAGVAVAAVVRNLPDLLVGELLPKAKTGGIELRDQNGDLIDGGVDADGNLITTATEAYRATLDHGRFGDGSFITHILAGQSANPGINIANPGNAADGPDIPGIGQGVDDLDVYALNYLAEPGRTGADYDAPVDFLTMQATATEVLQHVTGPDLMTEDDTTDSRRRIVLFSNPLTPLELMPTLSCTNSANSVIRIDEVVTDLNTCILRGVQANLGTNGALYSGASVTNTEQTDWFYHHAAALSQAGKPNAATYPIVVVPAGDIAAADSVFLATSRTDSRDTAGGYLAPTANIGTGPANAIAANLINTLRASLTRTEGDAGQLVTTYIGPTNSYARLPGLEGEITRDTGSDGTLNADFSHLLVVVALLVDGADNLLDPASSSCGGGEAPAVARIRLACIAAPGSYEAVLAASGQMRVIGTPSFLLSTAQGRSKTLGITADDISQTNDGSYGAFGGGSPVTIGRIALSFGDRLYVRPGRSAEGFGRDNRSHVVNFAAPLGITETAAAIATASLAIVADRFSGDVSMSNAAILQRLKDTADKSGEYADAAQYGNGVIDLAAATAPVPGPMALPLTGHASGRSVSLQTGALRQLSAAFGDALSLGLGAQRYIVLDGLKSPFAYSAAGLLLRTEKPVLSSIEALGRHSQRIGTAGDSLWTVQTRYSLSDPSRAAMWWRTQGMALSVSQDISPGLLSGIAAQNPLSAAPLQGDSALYAPWASQNYRWQTAGTRVALGPTELSLIQFAGRSEQNEQTYSSPKQSGHIVGVSGQWGKTRLGTQLLNSAGTDELLGLSSGLPIGDTQLRALNVWGTRSLSHNSSLLWSLWQLNAEANGSTALLAGAQNLKADAWTVGYSAHRWMVRLEQPLRMRSGELHLRLPSAHAADSAISFDSFSLNPSPSGRELRLQTDFAIPLRRGTVQFSAGMASEPGHISEAQYSPYALMTLSLRLN